MIPQISLHKRALVPLLAAAAAILYAPAHAATATLIYYGSPGPGTIGERVKCTIEDDSSWNKAVFYAQQLAQNGDSGSYISTGFLYSGPGDYYAGGSISGLTPGTYNCWCICSGYDYYNNPWNVSTGGTNYMTLPR